MWSILFNEGNFIMLVLGGSAAIPPMLVRSEQVPPYIGPWPWQLMANMAAATLLLIHIMITGFIGILLFGINQNNEFNYYSVALVGFWFLTYLLTLASIIIIYIRRQIRPELVETPPPEELCVLAEEASAFLSASEKNDYATVTVSCAEGRGPNMEVRASGHNKLEILIRKRFYENWPPRSNLVSIPKSLARAFHRFMIYHELGHYLNGDIRTANLGVAMIMGHVLFIFSTIIGAALCVILFLISDDSGLLLVSVFLEGSALVVCVLLVMERSFFARFHAERERRADQRALFSLNKHDHDVLFADRSQLKKLTLLYFAVIDGNYANKENNKLLEKLRRIFRLFEEILLPMPKIESRVDPLNYEPKFPNLSQRIVWGIAFGAQITALSFVGVTTVGLAWFVTGIGNELSQGYFLTGFAALLICLSSYFAAATEYGRMNIVTDFFGRIKECFTVMASIILPAIVLFALLMSLVGYSVIAMGTDMDVPSAIRSNSMALAACIGVGFFMGWMLSQSSEVAHIDSDDSGTPLGAHPLSFCIAAFLIMIPVGGSLFYQIGLVEEWVTGISLSVFFGILPFLGFTMLLHTEPNRFWSHIPFGMLPATDAAVGFRLFFRDFYMVHTQPTMLTVLRLTGFCFLSMLGVLVMFTLIAEVFVNYNDDVTQGLASLMALVTLGMIALTLFPNLNTPRQVQILTNSNLETIIRLRYLADIRTDARLDTHTDEFLAALAELLSKDEMWKPILPHPLHRERLMLLSKVVHALFLAGREDLIAQWRGRIAESIQSVVNDDYSVSAYRGGPSSLLWTVFSTKLICEGELYSPSVQSDSLRSLECLVKDRMATPSHGNSIAQSFRRRELYLGATTIMQYGKSLCARSAMTMILEELMDNGIQKCGLSTTEVAHCLRYKDDSQSILELDLAKIVKQRLWALMHCNLQLKMLPILDCVEAASILRVSPNLLPHGLNMLLDKSLEIVLNEDLPLVASS